MISADRNQLVFSVEAGRKAWHESAYIVSMHLLHLVVMSLHLLVTRIIPVNAWEAMNNI